jgi:carbamoyl-phosphate synthase large subunit
MPKRTDIKSILIIGAGPIVIGQACEFDYSGTQACKALKEEGYRVILVNSNPATIMTDPELADATYIEPITPEMVAKIIDKERPDAVLPTMGGQTALNTALALAKDGTLDKYGCKLIGASPEAIEMAENRQLFNEAMKRIGLEVPRNAVVHTLKEALKAVKRTGLPAIIRPSFTLGGSGGGVAHTMEEFERIVLSGLDASPTNEVLIDESIIGWKEFEMEVVRDKKDNCIIICSIENLDPMGVHTGDSITVAPALTLTDKELQIMRNASLAVLREIGVETGGSNVQFAINPKDGRMLVIEMNPRVSRSSALASKATGFPIAKVAAKLAVGYTLDELQNDVVSRGKGAAFMPASFEPSLDYVVIKMPRFTFEKFPGSDNTLTSAMKSVGEVMAIGGTFQESLQKALRSMETGICGFDPAAKEDDDILALMQRPTPNRMRYIADAFRRGLSVEEIQAVTEWDPWFLRQIEEIIQQENKVKAEGLGQLLPLKQMGFSDKRLAQLTGKKESEITALRHKQHIRPVYKRVDTCAAEFESSTPYMYSTYWGSESEAAPTNKTKTIILGSGPNRIGQGVEFDYACVHAAYALKEAGYETIMINCNPETVSTDYDTSDRLYFEPLTLEDVMEIYHVESSNGKVKGINVQFGGQTPLKLAHGLEQNGVPLLGTSHDAIDLAEDRERFKKLLQDNGLKQPVNFICKTEQEVKDNAGKIGFPVVVRPSYVLGGRAMAIIHDEQGLLNYLSEVREFFEAGPLLLDSFLVHAAEIDVDAIADGTDVYIAGVMEHIEEAGIHSGDSACSLPPHSLTTQMIDRLKEQTRILAKALKVVGLMNVQFATQGDDIYILEVNPRSSRTVPFVAKATGVPVAKIAARVMAGEKLKSFNLDENKKHNHMAVKEVVFPFARFSGVDVLLGPEMKSTGEVMGLDKNFDSAFAKAQIAAGAKLPMLGTVFISVKEEDKPAMVRLSQILRELQFDIVATSGTASYLEAAGIEVASINKVIDGSPHIVDKMKENGVQLVINTTEGSKAISDSFSIRRTALLSKIPYATTVAGAREMVMAIKRLKTGGGLEVAPLQSYFA